VWHSHRRYVELHDSAHDVERGHAMAAAGTIKRGSAVPFTPHCAAICMVACALPGDPAKALQAAMVMRDWRGTGPAPGRKLAAGMANSALHEIKLIRVLCAEVYAREASSWSISPVEALGHGVAFSKGDYDGRVPEAIVLRSGGWVQIPSWVLEQFGRDHGIAQADQRRVNELLLGRIARTLRPEARREAAE
jgi:hypothetical protein